MPHADDEERHRAERARRVALFRYELIQDLIDPALSSRQRGRLVRELAEHTHQGPFGEQVGMRCTARSSVVARPSCSASSTTTRGR